MEPARLAYFAGLIDGQGCLTIKGLTTMKHGRKNFTYHPELRVRMCDPRPLVELQRFFGGNLRQDPPGSENGTRHRRIFTYYCNNRIAEEIIRTILPYLICKRDEAIAFLEYFQVALNPFSHNAVGSARAPVPEKYMLIRQEYYLKLRALKRRLFDGIEPASSEWVLHHERKGSS